MTALLRKNKEEDTGEDQEVKKSEEKKSAKSSKSKKKKISKELKANADLVNKTIILPIVSEDAISKNDLGKYVFEIGSTSNKKEVARAIESLYGVDVVKVNIIRNKPKTHNFRMISGKKKGKKKAVVTIKSGQEIKLFES
ncbi:MAG: 50S ribosomal protein L23 [Candidatus Moraniibacteriota bacterium]